MQLLNELEPLALDPATEDEDILSSFVTAAGYRVSRDATMPASEKLELLEKAHQTVARCRNQSSLPWLRQLVMEQLCEMGELQRAVDTARGFLSQPAEPDYFELHSRNLLAASLCDLGRRSEASEELDTLAECLADLAARGGEAWAPYLPPIESQLLVTRARIDFELGSPDRAAAAVARAQQLAESSRDPKTIANALLCRADFALSTKQADRVEREIGAALENDTFGELGLRAKLLLQLGVAQCQLERQDASREKRAEKTLNSALALGLPANDRSRAQATLIDVLLREGRTDHAVEVARKLQSSMPTTLPARDLAQLGRVALARDANKAELTAMLARLEGALDAFLEDVHKIPPRPGGVGFLHITNRRQVVAVLIELALAVHGDERGAAIGLDFALRAQAAGTLARHFEAGPVTLADVRRDYLGDGHGALVYLPAREGTHVFAIDDASLVHERIAEGSRELRNALRPLRTALWEPPAARGSEELETQTKKLRRLATNASRDLLPTSVMKKVESWSRITVVGGDMLLDIPFACLVAEDGSMLGRERAFVTMPSLPLGVAMARAAGRGNEADESLSMQLYATLSPKGPPAGLRAARFDDADAERLTQRFEPDHVATHLGSECTREALLEADLDRTSILHLVAHGDYDPMIERGARLLLADEALTCTDIDELSFSGLAVLMACESARGPLRQGDDSPAHLGGAFLWAGARAVILSPAALHFETSMDLMERFYPHIQGGRSPAEALRLARRETAGGEDPLAAFHREQIRVFGLGHAPLER